MISYEKIDFKVANEIVLLEWCRMIVGSDDIEFDSVETYFRIKSLMAKHGYYLTSFIKNDSKHNVVFNHLFNQLKFENNYLAYFENDSLTKFKKKYFLCEDDLRMVDFVLIEEDGEEDCVAVDEGSFGDHKIELDRTGFEFKVKFVFPYSDYISVDEFDSFLKNEKDGIIHVWYKNDYCENVEC